MSTIPFAPNSSRSYTSLSSVYGGDRSSPGARPASNPPAQAPASPIIKVDSVDLSPSATAPSESLSPLVARIRAEIASGEYERDLDLKLEVAADKIIRDLNI